MSSRIHHATAKKARKFGVELVAVWNEFEARKNGQTLACHASASVALEKAIAKLGAKDAAAIKRIATRGMGKRKAKERDTIRTRGAKDYNEDELLGEGELDEPEGEGRSIIKVKYKQAYKARVLKISCSDDLAVQLAKHLKIKDEDGKLRIDGAKLKSFARANGCWDPKYADLNVGMQRMNVINRLRAKIRRDKHVVVWG